MKKMLVLLSVLVLGACSVSVPKELSLIKDLDMLKVFYPTGWTVADGLGGGVVIENENQTISIPINIQQYQGAQKNNVESIPEIMTIARKPAQGVKMNIKRISGLQCIWMESTVLDQVIINAFVPLDNAIISITTIPRKNGDTDVTAKDLELARMIIENMEIK